MIAPIVIPEHASILVRARMIEFMAGDSCVQIEVGSQGHLQKFWVPTKDIVGLEGEGFAKPE